MEQLLTTKLYIPPLRSDLVPRPHLFQLLNKGANRKLTLVSATAGFGKSTLVTSWLAENGVQTAWLSLDQDDNDPARFWTYIIAAIQAVDQELGNEARQIISSPQLRSAEPGVISLINDISQLVYDLVLVLDDYHVIEEKRIHDRLSFLLDNQPPNLHLILITRIDPPMALARLRAHSQLAEIRAEDLQFSTDETTVLLNEKMDLDLKPEQIAALNERAEGWIVGLQLAALALKGHPSYETFIEQFTGSHQFVLDYLTEEVLGTLPDDLHNFLLYTSILDRFCAESCFAVTGNKFSQQILKEIRVGNLFLIPLDTSGVWFRYHHLFAEVLRSLLERDHPTEISALHQNAALWFDDQGYAGEAVEHALHSDDMEQAKELILKHWFPLLSRGEVTTVLRWLDSLLEEMSEDDPSVILAYCWALYLSGQSRAIVPHLERANDAYERMVSAGTLTGIQQNSVAAQLSMLRSVVATNHADYTGAISHAKEAIRLVPPEDLDNAGTAWSMLGGACAGNGDYDRAIEALERGAVLMHTAGDLIGAFMATFGRVLYMIIQGRLNEASYVCHSAVERAIVDGHSEFPAAGWLYFGMAWVELERYHLDEAQVHLDSGLRIARPGSSDVMLRSGLYIPAQVAAARGELEAAVEILEAAEKIISAMDDPYLTGTLNREWTMLYLSVGELDAAREKLQVLIKKSKITQDASLLLACNWMIARLQCAEGRYVEALSGLDQAIRRSRAANSMGELIRLLAMQAVALNATSKHEQARAALSEAVALGAPEGYIRRWLDAGPMIGPLIQDFQAGSSKASHPYLDAVLNAFQSAFGNVPLKPAGNILDPLTNRELEILRLICEGYSNPEIAKELVLAYNTVRKHTSNIYSKLGVHSRTQAITLVRDQNLI